MINNHTPEIRFGGFTASWEQRKLGEVSPLQRGFDLTKSKINKGPYPVVFSNGIGAWNSEYKVKAPGVVTGRSGSIGNVSYIEQDYWPHNTSLWVTNFFDNYPLYIYYLYQHVDLSKFATGSGVPTLNRNDVHNYSVFIPSVKEQIKIADFLKRLDKTITLKEQELVTLKQTKQGLLQKMFPKEGESVPEVRFPGCTGDWEQRKLEDIAEFNPKSNLPEQFVYVDLESVIGIELISHRTEQKETAPSRAQRVAEQGDVFYQTVRPYQKNNYLFELPFDNYVFSTGYAQMRPILDSYFLLCSLQEERFVSDVLDRCTGTSYPAINSNHLAQIQISVPTLEEERTKIGNFFKQLDKTIALQQQELDVLQETKKAFLQKMFV